MDADWRYKESKREIDRVDGRVERLETRINDNERRSRERSLFWFQAIFWGLDVAFITTIVVLAITGDLRHH